MESFDQAAKQYEEYGHIQKEMAAWLADWIPLQRKGSALEVAAGTGFFTRHLIPWQGTLTATDLSRRMIMEGRERLPEIAWRLCSAHRLPVTGLDWVFSSSFLQWVEDPVSLFRHWHSRLAPGGRLLGGLFSHPTLSELRDLSPEASPLVWRKPEEWEAALKEAGFSVLRFSGESRIYLFPSCVDLLRVLHRVGAAPHRRFSAGRLRGIIQLYDQRHGRENLVRSTWGFFRFEAEKA